MTFFVDIRCSWPSYPMFRLIIDAPSAVVAMAKAEAWCAGFQCGTEQHVNLTVEQIGVRKPRGITYFPMTSWSEVKMGVHNQEMKG